MTFGFLSPYEDRTRAILIAVAIAGLGLLLWTVPMQDEQTHNYLHHLNFIPLMLAGMLYAWKGALLATLFAAAVQGPHVWATWQRDSIYATDQIVELAIFGAAAVIAGFLMERQTRQRLELERTTRELARVYSELQQHVEHLKKAERLSVAGQLSAGLAHEIRNPLASIAGAAGILKRGNASSQNFSECLEIIEKESQRLNKLLGAFLEFARPRPPKFQRTDPTAVFDSVLTLARHASGAGSVRLKRGYGEDLPEVECDPEQLKQVLLNLLINAIQASPAEGNVELLARVRGGRLEIAVRDEGCGITPGMREHLFEPFFTTRECGTGLGLAVASRIVAQHGGVLEAENNAARGMTFRFDLPLKQESAE